MKNRFEKINNILINIVLTLSIFILLSGIWDWVSKNSTTRGMIITIISAILVLLMVVLRIVHLKRVKKILKGQLS